MLPPGRWTRPAAAPASTTENERNESTVSAENKAQKRAEKTEKRRQEEQKNRRSMVIYSVVAVVVAVAAAAMMIFNSGLLQRSLTALDVNGTKYSAADVQYYYKSLYNSNANYFNSGVSVKKQVYDETIGQTWYDYLMEQAVEQLTRNTALAQKAQAEGYTLSDDAQTTLNTFLTQLDTAWIGQTTSRESLIRANFGPYMTYDRLAELVGQELLASDYAQSRLEDIEHPESDYDAYYAEHADELDTVTYSYFLFRASVPTTDADGNPVELTDEEKASQLEFLKLDQHALADEVKAKLEEGADPEALAEEYQDQLYDSAVSSRATGSDLTAYTYYGDWLLDSGRKVGDVTLTGQDLDGSANYYVVVYEGRELDQEQTHSIRHLLARAGSITADPTQEQYDEAEKKAQAFWDEWKAGEATEASFADLAAANSDDTSSKSNGGLIANITSSSNYVEAFRSWALDPARKEGDVGLVKTEYGWHLMYYVSTGEPVWRQTALSALRDQDYETLADGASQGWTVTRGAGMRLVGA